MSDLELHHQPGSLAEQMTYAKAIATGDMLPTAYRNKPANVMLAIGLGQAMGLSPAEALWRIDVIGGKPTASAELIASNVRKAGHTLRLRTDEAAGRVTCTIIRADDPDFEHTVSRDMEWAKSMGLTGKDNYKKQPLTMLQHRATTACARLACPEALYGVGHTADELADVRPASGVGDRLRVVAEPVEQPDEPAPLDTSGPLARHMFALMGETGITERDQRLLYVSDTVGREVASSSDMTEADARAVIASLEADLEPVTPEDDQ